MGTRYTDGDMAIVTQDGARRIMLPLQTQDEYYATITDRRVAQLTASYDTILPTRRTFVNQLTYSSDWSGWTGSTAAINTTGQTDPEGGTGAIKITEGVVSSAHNFYQTMTVASGALTAGVFAKMGERRYFRLRVNNGTDGDLAIAVFDLSAGTVLSGSGAIKKLLNGWFWCFVTGTATIANSSVYIDLTSDGTTFSYLGVSGSGDYFWNATCVTGAQTANFPAIATTAATRSISAPPVDPDDPIAFLTAETEQDTSMLEYGVSFWLRRYARIPYAQTIPSSFLFTTPNYTPQIWGSTALPPPGVVALAGNYGVIALAAYPGFSTAIAAAVTGYYDVSFAVSGFTGSPATVLTVVGNNFVAGQRLLYCRTVGGVHTTYYFDISSVVGSAVNGTSTFVSDQSGGTTSFDVYVASVLITSVNNCRRITRSSTDYGQTYNLVARIIENYYIIGVSPGISSQSDIPVQQPYSLASYLGAWASAATWFNVQSSQLTYWRDGLILKTSYTQAALTGIT